VQQRGSVLNLLYSVPSILEIKEAQKSEMSSPLPNPPSKNHSVDSLEGRASETGEGPRQDEYTPHPLVNDLRNLMGPRRSSS